MNRLVRGSIMVVTAAAAWACSTDLGKTPDQTDRLVADPSVLFVANDDSQAVEVEALNPEGQQLAAEFSISNPGSGIVATRDTGFLPIPGHGNSPTRARFIVRAATPSTFVTTSFTVSANGKDIVIPVNVTPAQLPADFSNPTPNVGDTVTITAPGAVRFTPTTTAQALSGSATVVGISADSLTASVVVGPGATASAIQFDDMVVPYIPGVLFDGVTSTGTVTTAPLASFTIGISDLTPDIGDQVTLTAPAPFKFTSGSTVHIPAAPTLITSLSADSSTMTFLIGPNADSVLIVDNLVVSGAPGLGFFTLGTNGVVTSPVLTTVAVVFSDNTPNGGAPVTMTAPAGFRFFPSVSVTVGGLESFIVSISADSSTVVFVPPPDAQGTPTIANFGAQGSPLALSADASTTLTVGPSPFPGTDDPATAPTISIPTPGNSATFYDGGGFGAGIFGADRIYAFTLTGQTQFTLTLDWNNAADIDILWVLGDISDFTCNFNGATGAQPETSSCDLPAGDYFLVVNLFDGDAPPVLQFTLSNP